MSKCLKLFEKNTKNVLRVKGMSQKDLAIRTGIQPQHVSSYLSGKIRPGIEIIENIAKALDVEVYQLLSKDGIKTTKIGPTHESLMDTIKSLQKALEVQQKENTNLKAKNKAASTIKPFDAQRSDGWEGIPESTKEMLQKVRNFEGVDQVLRLHIKNESNGKPEKIPKKVIPS